MKKFIAISLCLAFLALTLPAQTNAPPTDKGLAIVCFVLGCTATGCYLVWKIKGCLPQDQHVTLVLEKSSDPVNGSWIPVCTNSVVLTDREWIEIFRENICELRIAEPKAFFRAVIAK